MSHISLNGLWKGKCFTEDNNVDFTFDGTVPGCVHTDLKGTKIPNDLFYRNNSDEIGWIENRDFEYSKSFEIKEKPKNARLVFEGLDVYTDIYLNGKHLGETDNMFIPHSFEVYDILREGENLLSVRFYSPIKRVEGLPLCEGAFTRERMHTRRIQCTYGWDWVARFVTAGIWRDVYIDCSEGFDVKNAYIYTDTVSKEYASVVVEAEFENYENGGYADMELVSPEGNTVYKHRFFVKESSLKTYIDVSEARLWYPRGYGEQPLYKLKICNKEFTFGIRTAKVIELADKKGSPYFEKCISLKDSASARVYDRNEEFSGFQLLVNDVPVFCRGANWVPSEPFPSDETDEKITTLLELADEAGVNMLRVWGGGIFEKQHFYNECDRLGILVTQDFLMACGQYPEKETYFVEQIAKEAEFAARSLRNHPSLVWWSGDNENAVNGHDGAEDYNGRTVIYNGIRPVLLRLDPHRRFFLSSPYGGVPYASKTKGTTHNTQYLGCSILPYIQNQGMDDYKEHFSEYLARFIAEEPTLGAVSLPSLKKFMTEDDIYNGETMWVYHTKTNPALKFSIFEALLAFTQKVLGEFKDGKDKLFKLQYAQYEWIRITLENVRRNRGFSNGIVYWMWNDCWPASSGWALVDYYCLPKASFYSFKRCSGKIMASIDKKDGYEVYLCSDGVGDKEVTLNVSYVKDGVVTKIRGEKAIARENRSENVLTVPLSEVPDGAFVICEVVGDTLLDRAFYKNGALHIAPTDSLRVIEKTENSITVCSDEYVHAVELCGEAIFEDNWFSLLPGEKRTVSYRAASGGVSEEITACAYTLEF